MRPAADKGEGAAGQLLRTLCTVHTLWRALFSIVVVAIVVVVIAVAFCQLFQVAAVTLFPVVQKKRNSKVLVSE